MGVEGSEVDRPHVRALLEARRRGERRRNFTVVAIVLVLAILLAAFAYRPATVIGVHGSALAHSIEGRTCVTAKDGGWRCQIVHTRGSGESHYVVPYAVTTNGPFGCWTARRVGKAGKDSSPRRTSGCIDVADVVGAL